jgi:hypothetical protein
VLPNQLHVYCLRRQHFVQDIHLVTKLALLNALKGFFSKCAFILYVLKVLRKSLDLSTTAEVEEELEVIEDEPEEKSDDGKKEDDDGAEDDNKEEETDKKFEELKDDDKPESDTDEEKHEEL